MPKRNPTSSIRSGFDYQDLWVLKLFGEWLSNPEQYQWIQIETSPDDEIPSKFYLDDIVCFGSEDLYWFYQIKHRQDPRDQWTWDNLLVPSTKKGTSYIKKWSLSLLPHLEKTKEAFFITNGQASEEIGKYLDKETIDIEKIKKEDRGLHDRLKEAIGTDQEVIQFFEKMRFCFSQKENGDLEKETREFFYSSLGAVESGIVNLLSQIKKESRQKFTQQLTIATIKEWCEFDNPRPLYENFVIPPDFEFFDDDTHQDILNDLQNIEGGIKVMSGKPGVGKSVYLSKLDEELNNAQIMSIKHHYHISPQDSNPQERLNSERVVEAIKAQFKRHSRELGDLANKNSKEIPLNEFIKTAAANLKEEGKTLVIIIDGLDHVLRYGDQEELESFLREICFPQSGLWIVIGMQMFAKKHLPQIVFDKCPENNWLSIKGLNKASVLKIIRTNIVKLHLPEQDELLDNLIDKIYAISSGNPLHLRYCIEQLKNQLGINVVTEYSCNDLIPYDNDIERYYDSLWRQIPEKAKTVLLALSIVNFHFTEQQLIECVSSFLPNPSDVTRSFKAIEHLVSRNFKGEVTVYHNSFEVFLKNRPEAKQQQIAIKTNIKRWLEQSTCEYLKWAELRIIEHELGNSNPILEIDRAWLIDAICAPSNFNQISNQMQLAIKVAYEREDFAKALQISYLHTYFLNSKDFIEEETELIWKEALQQNENVLDIIDLKQLPTAALVSLSEIADSKGDVPSIKAVINILTERLDSQEYLRNSIPPVSSAILSVLPFDRTHDSSRVHNYIKQFRDLNITGNLYRVYVQRLLVLGQKDKVETLLQYDLMAEEKKEILIQCAIYGLKNNTEDLQSFFSIEYDLPNICLIYNYFMTKKGIPLTPLPGYDVFRLTTPEHDREEQAKWTNLYNDQFLLGLSYGLVGKREDVEQWIKEIPNSWSAKGMAKLYSSALKIADKLQRESRISYSDLFEAISDLDELKWPVDRDSINFQFALRDALKSIFKIVISLKTYLGDDYKIHEDDFTVITKKATFFSRSDLINIILEMEIPLFANNVYQKIKDEEATRLSHTINYFTERTKEYVNLSKLARLYGETYYSKLVLKKAANNLLGYGYHKDVYLFEVIEALEMCAKGGISKDIIDGWINRIIPIIENVKEYTDGDETNHLPFELSDFLSLYDKKLLCKNYFYYADKEEFYHAEKLFQSVLKSFLFTNGAQIAVATTALDKDSVVNLKDMAGTNIGAALALKSIHEYFGEINYPKEENPPISHGQEPKPDYSQVKPENIMDHLSAAFENKWSWDKYLVEWLNYWLVNDRKERIYSILKQIIDKHGIKSISGDVLDFFYPLAYELDNEVAFEALCQAQINDHGWAHYWTEKKRAEKRWRFIKDKYPQRYMEFFRKSTNYHVPLSRGIEYLLLFNDLNKAASITEAAVQFAEFLMADLSLPTPDWSIATNEIDEIDILFQRLHWPSLLVQERAATSIGYLLGKNEEYKGIIFERLMEWLEQQKTESTTAVGLLPIIKAFYMHERSKRSCIDLKAIIASLRFNSVVIEELIKELARLMEITDHENLELPEYMDIDIFPSDYSTDSFFLKYIKSFLAPVYFIRATEIENKTGRPFIKQWSFNSDVIINDLGVKPDSEQLNYYGHPNTHDDFLSAFSPKISEIYRSAFLRVLQKYYKDGHIPDDIYLKYAYATLPIELSKWKIAPNRSPIWWPKLKRLPDNAGEKEKPVIKISFESPIEALIESRGGDFLLSAEGAIQPANGWKESDPECSFFLIGFAYKVLGPQVPTAAEVNEAGVYVTNIFRNPSQTVRPFNFLEDQGKYLSTENEYIRIKDLLVYPLVAYENELSISLWQSFRDPYPLNISLPLSSGLKFVVQKNGWIYQSQNGKTVVTYLDWLEGLKERYHRDLPVPYGHYIRINRHYLNTWMDNNKLRLGYLLKTNYTYRKYKFDEAKEYKDIKLLNVSNIIIS